MTDDGPAARMRKGDAERLLVAQLVESLQYQNATMSDRYARLASQVVNGVLEAGTAQLDTSGTITRDYQTTIGCLVVTNVTGATIVVSADSPGPSAPTIGVGVHQIPNGAIMTVPIGRHQFTIYGAPAGLVSFQAWTGLQPLGVLA